MPLPTSKQALIELVEKEYRALDAELRLVPETHARTQGIEGNVSPADLIAYQIGWGRLLLGWYRAGLEDRMPILPAEGFKWNELGALARHFYQANRERSYESLLAEFRSVVEEVLAMIGVLDEPAIFENNYFKWIGKWPLAKWVVVNTSSPFKSARTRLRKWKRSMGLQLA